MQHSDWLSTCSKEATSTFNIPRNKSLATRDSEPRMTDINIGPFQGMNCNMNTRENLQNQVDSGTTFVVGTWTWSGIWESVPLVSRICHPGGKTSSAATNMSPQSQLFLNRQFYLPTLRHLVLSSLMARRGN